MKTLRSVVVLVLALALSAPVLAADYQAGFDAYDRGDYATALKEWRPLAGQGVAEAQFLLGQLYHQGKGMPQDYTGAEYWYSKAARQGNAMGQLGLGSMYAYGNGVPQNYTEAVKWYRKSANQGEIVAQSILGVMYEEGNGLPQDFVLAHMWFNLVAGSGGAVARTARDLVARKMTPEQIAEAERLAREWKPK